MKRFLLNIYLFILFLDRKEFFGYYFNQLNLLLNKLHRLKNYIFGLRKIDE